MRTQLATAGVWLILTSLALPVLAQEPATQEQPAAEAESPDYQFAEEEAAVREAIAAYVAAFNLGDAPTAAGFWSADGVFVNKMNGNRVEGREAITAGLTEIFAEETKRQLVVDTESIQFISPNVALERGIATVVYDNETTEVTSYRGIYIEQDGKWLIDRMTEDEMPEDDSRYQQLQDLEWLVGSWVDETEDATIRTECFWTRNRTYIARSFRVETEGGVSSSGLQLIGWDPAEQQIRSWLFDSAGGFVEGKWTLDGDRWYVKSVGTLADGSRGSFTSVFQPIDDNSYSWQKTQRVVSGELLPNIDEVVIVRE